MVLDLSIPDLAVFLTFIRNCIVLLLADIHDVCFCFLYHLKVTYIR